MFPPGVVLSIPMAMTTVIGGTVGIGSFPFILKPLMVKGAMRGKVQGRGQEGWNGGFQGCEKGDVGVHAAQTRVYGHDFRNRAHIAFGVALHVETWKCTRIQTHTDTHTHTHTHARARARSPDPLLEISNPSAVASSFNSFKLFAASGASFLLAATQAVLFMCLSHEFWTHNLPASLASLRKSPFPFFSVQHLQKFTKAAAFFSSFFTALSSVSHAYPVWVSACPPKADLEAQHGKRAAKQTRAAIRAARLAPTMVNGVPTTGRRTSA